MLALVVVLVLAGALVPLAIAKAWPWLVWGVYYLRRHGFKRLP